MVFLICPFVSFRWLAADVVLVQFIQSIPRRFSSQFHLFLLHRHKDTHTHTPHFFSVRSYLFFFFACARGREGGGGGGGVELRQTRDRETLRQDTLNSGWLEVVAQKPMVNVPEAAIGSGTTRTGWRQRVGQVD